jgi:glycosyltransferase involved in cell wall biosynthesis
MKIAIIQPVLPKYDISFFNALAKQSPELDIVVLADIETKNSLNQIAGAELSFSVQHLPLVEARGIVRRPGLMAALKEVAADHVIFNGNPRDISQIAAMLQLRMAAKPFSVWGMFHRIGGLRAVTRAYYRLCGHLADVCMTYTEIGARTLIDLGVAKSKIGIVGTAIDESVPMAHAAALTEEHLRAFALEQGLVGKKVVLQVVRLSRFKRPELLIEAARELVRRRPDVVFVLIGAGEMRSELEAMVQSYGLASHVRFVGALYEESQLALWYGCADVFVIPTCIGLSAHHALSYGVPVVTDNSLDNQASESVTLYHGLNSMLYEEGDVASMAEAIDTVLADPELAALLSRNARVTAASIHSMSRKVSGFLKTLQRTANARG